MRRAARKFSNEWSGTTTPQFLTAAYDIKSGISSLTDAGVADFTALAGLTAKATKSTVEEMTSLFATGYGIYRRMFAHLSDTQFGELFSAGLAASVREFKTTGPQMQAAIESLGAEAATAKVPLEEQLAILGKLQQTMSGAEAGTKYRSLLQSVAEAGKKLGLPFLDADKQLKSLPDVISLIRKKYGKELDAVERKELQTALGRQEALAVITLLYDQTDELKKSIAGLNQEMGKGKAVTEEMARPRTEAWAKLLQKTFNA